MKEYYIYLFTFPNGKKYCGYTSQCPERRWGSTGHNYDKCPLVSKAIKKYGWNSVKKEIIFKTQNQEEAFNKEKEIITNLKLQNPKFGYNIDKGGRPHGTGDHLTEAGRKSLSEKSKARWADPDFRKRMIEERKGRKPTQQCIEASRIATSKRRKGVTPINAKPVEQLDIQTNSVITEYISATHAAIAVMGEKQGCSNILNVCKGKRKTAYGYKWRFKL